MELKALGIPVLASDCGGASELSGSSLFKFRAGDANEFNKKLEEIINNKHIVNEYWKYQRKLVTIGEHAAKLMEYYTA
jgi:glycosyltransferase involved in cell wall biosynthesis